MDFRAFGVQGSTVQGSRIPGVHERYETPGGAQESSFNFNSQLKEHHPEVQGIRLNFKFKGEVPLEKATYLRKLKSARLARKSRARLARVWPPRGRQKQGSRSRADEGSQ